MYVYAALFNSHIQVSMIIYKMAIQVKAGG